jgi:hypothetical protein
MNCPKIEKVLREQTINMFSKEWYQTTSLKIAKSIEAPSQKSGGVYLNFSIKDLQNMHTFFETIKVNRYYSNKELFDSVKEVVVDTSPKRVKMELQKFALENNYRIKLYNSAGVGRGFVLSSNL